MDGITPIRQGRPEARNKNAFLGESYSPSRVNENQQFMATSKAFSSRMSQQASLNTSQVVGHGLAFHAINNKRKELVKIDHENANLYLRLRNK